MCSPLARLRRSRHRFDAVFEQRAQALEDSYAEAEEWPPSRFAVQDALDVLVVEGCVHADAWPPSRPADGGVSRPELEPKGPENLSPMQIAVLG